MPLSSPVVFPLFPIVDGKCGCGNEKCARVGKHPQVAWGDLKLGDAVPLPVDGAGYGIKTGAAPKGSSLFVVDLDGDDACEVFNALGPCPDTFIVQTPRGFHLYFEHPGFVIRNSVSELGKGVDVRGDGGFVVGPGSPHRSGETYETAVDVVPASAPDWLLDWLRARPAPTVSTPSAGDVADPVERSHRRDLYTKYLQTTTPCVEGRAGDQRLFEVVQHGAYDLALPTEDVLELVQEHFDPRCVPPWGDELAERVRHKSSSAKSSSTRPRAEPPPAALASFFLEPPPKPALEPRKRDEGIFWDDWDTPVEPPIWLVESLIPAGTVGGLVAHGSSLKTWTALSLAAAVARGVPWLDKYPTKKGRALVLDYESGQYEIRRRVRLLEGGRVVGLGAWSYPPKRVDDVEFWKELAAIEGISLLCIDSLAEGTTPGVDENDKAAAYPLQLAARYTEGTGASVVFIHHSKKDDGGDARKAVRGSTAIFAAMDWCYGFEPIEETTTIKRMRMSCIKPCMGAKPMPVPLELTDAGLHLFDTTTEPKPLKTTADIEAAIRLALLGTPTTVIDVLLKRANVDLREGRLILKDMIGKHEVAKIEGVGYVLDSPAARVARIVEAVSSGILYKTETAIATASSVDTSEVDACVSNGTIFRSAEGRWLPRHNAVRNS